MRKACTCCREAGMLGSNPWTVVREEDLALCALDVVVVKKPARAQRRLVLTVRQLVEARRRFGLRVQAAA